jgi:diguanylate cyclase (GGDEF)-like protein
VVVAGYAATERPGEGVHPDWVHPAGVGLAAIGAILGLVQARKFRDSYRAARVFAVTALALAIAFMWLFAFDPSEYAFALVLLGIIEMATVMGRGGVLGGWLLGAGAYLTSKLFLWEGPAAEPDLAGMTLRLLMALGLAIGADMLLVELAGERARFRERIQDLDVVVWELDPSTQRVTFIDGALEQMMGVTLEQVASGDVSWTGLVAREDLADVEAAIDDVARPGGPDFAEFEFRRERDPDPARRFRSTVHRTNQHGKTILRGAIVDFSALYAARAKSQESSESLTHLVEELERRSEESGVLSEMGDLLAACGDADEAHLVLTRMLPRLFPASAGGVYLTRSSRNLVEGVARWGEMPSDESAFSPDQCWALRRGRPHVITDVEREVPCAHVTPAPGASYRCIPMLAQGEALGILHLRSTHFASDPALEDSREQLARSVAEHVGLALANFRLRETLRTQSIQDPLTGLYNRRFMTEFLERELHRAKRAARPLAVIMVDVDRLKHYNDTFGHETGDRLLRETGRLLTGSIRAGDLACRYGGDEFCLVLPEIASENAIQLAERIRESFLTLDLGIDADGSRPGLSMGLAVAPEQGWDGDSLLRAADEALYRAKGEGRNRVVVAA